MSLEEPHRELRLGSVASAWEERLAGWERDDMARRMWDRDPRLWSAEPVPELEDRLGWLDLPDPETSSLATWRALARACREEQVRHVLLLGMGGSSLAPEVFRSVWRRGERGPSLRVLDSTHPEVVHRAAQAVEGEKTLVLVASKSGTTVETLALFHFFWKKESERGANPGRWFVAVTDPGSPLERTARERSFRQVLRAPPDVGGRYSALSDFGMASAALLGVDPAELLERAQGMADRCGPEVPASENPALRLGAALGELGLAGRDKLTLVIDPSIEAFSLWIEQLVAESTGKEGKGIVPVAGEPLAPPEEYGQDRFFLRISLEGEAEPRTEERLRALERAGHPVARLTLGDRRDLAAEMFRWEMAVAAAGRVLGIHPFNQPDVELAKRLAREALEDGSDGGGGAEIPTAELGDQRGLAASLRILLDQARGGDYFVLQAWLPESPETAFALQRLRMVLRANSRLATTEGFGPRYLHSTGQLHKGGPNSSVHLQLLDGSRADLDVPEEGTTFRKIFEAQATGDARALLGRDRRFLRIRLGEDAAHGLARLLTALGS